MAALAFDTHKAVKALRDAGFDDPQAEAVIEQIGVAIGGILATRDDLEKLELRMEKLDLRMTIKLFVAVATGVALIKALDFLIG